MKKEFGNSKYHTYQISEKIKYLRKINNISQEELARRTGISKSSIGDIETNKFVPSSDSIIRICLALNVSADFIYSLDNRETQDIKDLIDIKVNPNNYLYVENADNKLIKNLQEIINLFNEKNKEDVKK